MVLGKGVRAELLEEILFSPRNVVKCDLSFVIEFSAQVSEACWWMVSLSLADKVLYLSTTKPGVVVHFLRLDFQRFALVEGTKQCIWWVGRVGCPFKKRTKCYHMGRLPACSRKQNARLGWLTAKGCYLELSIQPVWRLPQVWSK